MSRCTQSEPRHTPVTMCVALGCIAALLIEEMETYGGFCPRHHALWTLAGLKVHS